MMDQDGRRARLRAAKEALGVSRAELSRLLDTPLATLGQWLDGTRRAPGVAVVAAEAIARERARETKTEKIVRLAQSGVSRAEISEATGASATTIYQTISHARVAGLLPRHITLRDRVLSAAAADGTRTTREIAAIVGVPEHIASQALSVLRAKGVLPPHITLGDRVRPLSNGTRTAREIADATGLSIRQVYGAVSRLRLGGEIATLQAIDIPRARIPHEKILAMLEDGQNSGAISRAAGVSRQRVLQLAARHGLKLPHSRAAAAERRSAAAAEEATRRAEKEAQLNAAVDAIANGMSIRQCAVEFGIDPGRLGKLAAQAGVRSRHDSRWRGERLADRLAGGGNDTR